MHYSVKINAFEGPLDLLLHLIQRLEIDIYDIPVSEITQQYLDYIQGMRILKIEVASEYLVMAASLLEIKSKMLLPNQEDASLENDEEFEDDPRKELVRRLIEYRKFKEAAAQLQNQILVGHDVYSKPQSIIENQEDTPAINVTLFDMFAAFQKLLAKKKEKLPQEKTVQLKGVSIKHRMREITASLIKKKDWIHFDDLFNDRSREAIVVTFLALLELIKNDQILCQQERSFNAILIRYMPNKETTLD